MTVISSYEAQFKASGVNEVKNGFSEIAKAAALADRQARVNTQNLKDYAKSQIQTEKEKARAAQMAAKEQAKAGAASDAMWKKIGAGAAVAAAAVVKFGLDSYKAYQQYAGSVRDIALASGSTAEEASKLIQVLDDFEISAQDIMTATKAMTKNGLEPSLETMAKLADQYIKIEDPMKKNEFLLKNLGKAGLAYANAMNQGGDAMRANSAAINKNLILTDAQIKKAEEARLAVDRLNDAWEGTKVAVGGAVGGLILANDKLLQANENMRVSTESVMKTGQGVIGTYEEWKASLIGSGIAADSAALSIISYRGALIKIGSQMQYNANLQNQERDNWYEVSAAIRGVIDDSAEMQTARAKEISSAIEIQQANDTYKESQQGILKVIAELQTKKNKLHSNEKTQLKEINEKIDEQKDKYAEGAEAFGKAQAEKLAMMAAEKIALSDGVAGYTAAEAKKARAILSTASIATQAAFEQAIAQETITNAIADGTMSLQEMDRILKIMQKGYTIDVAINIQKQNLKNLQQELNTQAGGINGKFGGAIGDDVDSQASGGQLSGGWNLVGDTPGGGFVPGISELIKNGRVYSSSESAKLIQSGQVKVAKSYAIPNDDIYTTLAKPSAPVISSKSFASKSIAAGAIKSGGTSTSSGVAAVMQIAQQAAEMQVQTQSIANTAQVQITNMVTQLQQAQAAAQSTFEEMVAVMRNENPRAIGKQVAFELAKVT